VGLDLGLESLMLTAEQVREIIQEVMGNADFSGLPAGAIFQESGLDSLDQASILLALKDRYGIDFPDDIGSEMDSIEAILTFVATTKAQGT
jgi:acyl carrier protein